MTDLSDTFNVPELSDVFLAVKIRQEANSNDSGSQKVARGWFCSKAIISQSDFLKTKLLRWTENPPSWADRNKVHFVLEIHVADEEEIDALELILKCMYGASIPQEATSNALLLTKAYIAADMYCAPCCVEALATALRGLDIKGLGLPQLKALLTISFYGHKHMVALRQSCTQQIIEMFVDVPHIISTDHLRQQFCSLPYGVILSWLKSDDLRVHSENCVVYLLSEWVNSQGLITDQQLQGLALFVRVQHVSPMYLHCVLPQLTWFQKMEGASRHLVYMSVLGRPKDGSLTKQSNSLGVSPAWTLCKRKQIKILDSSMALYWEVMGPQLQDLLNGKKITSHQTYVNGAFCCLVAQSTAHPIATESDNFTLSLKLKSCENRLNPVICDSDMKDIFSHHRCNLEIKRPGSSNYWDSYRVDGVSGVNMGLGILIPKASGSTIKDAVGCLLSEGRIVVRATGIYVG